MLRGNRLTKDVAGGTTEDSVCVFDVEDRLTSETRGGAAISYGYADRGDLTSKTQGTLVTSYENDHLGRLTHVSKSDLSLSYSYIYAPTGDRICKFNNLPPEEDEWSLPSDGDTLCDYTASSGTEVYTGIYSSPGIDGRVARTNGSVNTFYFGDALQSVHQVTDDAGTVVRTQFTDAWGNDIAGVGSGSSGNAGDRFGFQGRESDSESGLQHFRARSYDPMTGRFLSRDRVPHPNLYLFVLNNPVNMVDPFGLDEWWLEKTCGWLEKHRFIDPPFWMPDPIEILHREATIARKVCEGDIQGAVADNFKPATDIVTAPAKNFDNLVKNLNQDSTRGSGEKWAIAMGVLIAKQTPFATLNNILEGRDFDAEQAAAQAGIPVEDADLSWWDRAMLSVQLAGEIALFAEAVKSLSPAEKARLKAALEERQALAARNATVPATIREGSADHIFRPDHNIVDTPANRQLLIDVASGRANWKVKDLSGNDWFYQQTPDGKYVWVVARNGKIYDGGINVDPPKVDVDMGLKKPK